MYDFFYSMEPCCCYVFFLNEILMSENRSYLLTYLTLFSKSTSLCSDAPYFSKNASILRSEKKMTNEDSINSHLKPFMNLKDT